MTNVDGWVVIGTDLNTSQLEKKLNAEEKELKKYEKEFEQLTTTKAEIEIEIKDYEEAKNKLEDMQKRIDNLQKETLNIDTSTPEGYEKYRQIHSEIADIVNQSGKWEQKVQESAEEYKKLSNNLEEVNQKLKENVVNQSTLRNSIEKTQSQIKLSTIKDGIDSIGKSMEQNIKKVGRWALAIVGVRGAYMAVRNAMNIIMQDDEQLKADIDYIKRVLAYTLEPVVRQIVEWLKQIMYDIAYIAKAWFGVNIFEKANQSLKNANSNAKELKKTLAGFDEMNILNTDGSVGTLGAIKTSFDVDNIESNVPDWLKDVVAWTNKATDGWDDFAGAVTLGGTALGIVTGKPGLAATSFLGYLSIALPKLAKSIKVVTGSNSLLESGLKTLFAFLVPQVGIPLILVEAFDKLSTSTDNAAQASLDLEEAQKRLRQAQLDTTNAISIYKDALQKSTYWTQQLKEAEEQTGLSGEELFKQVQDGTLTYLEMNDAQKLVYEAYLNNIEASDQLKTAEENLKKAEEEQTAAIDNERYATINDALAKLRAVKDYDAYKEAVVKAYNEGKISAGEARDFIEQACKDMSEDTAKTFTEDLPNNIKEGLNPDKYRTPWSRFKVAWNEFVDSLKTKWADFIDKLKIKLGITSSQNKSQTIISASIGTGPTAYAKGGILYDDVPMLASGAIINQPGRGVPLPRAKGGEAGIEGVLPLTDSQRMELLGASIGRNVTIYADIINNMNGRTISRELQKINNEEAFAYNR